MTSAHSYATIKSSERSEFKNKGADVYRKIEICAKVNATPLTNISYCDIML